MSDCPRCTHSSSRRKRLRTMAGIFYGACTREQHSDDAVQTLGRRLSDGRWGGGAKCPPPGANGHLGRRRPNGVNVISSLKAKAFSGAGNIFSGLLLEVGLFKDLMEIYEQSPTECKSAGKQKHTWTPTVYRQLACIAINIENSPGEKHVGDGSGEINVGCKNIPYL